MSHINHNLMALNVGNALNGHYSRLETSIRRLSTGLRINGAADDAAGLAIRELMRADVAALNQGARNASAAISMLQVADGALAIIDEKLIRMKELAEQAATGTYDSTQRLMIDSEYKAMAAEIDRIARATDFNGIKLLDGSLSGAHNGAGLTSTGAMKIHFGSANDSAEDYYYISIGDCTTSGLGLGSTAGAVEDEIEYIKIETWGDGQVKFQPQTRYDSYYDPGTNKHYFTDGNIYFSDYRQPGATRLDWITDGEIIKRLRPVQATINSSNTYSVYRDSATGVEYYSRGNIYTADPTDADAILDKNNIAHKEILDRLQDANKTVKFDFTWAMYETPQGAQYYSYNAGYTYVQDYNNPHEGVIRNNDPGQQALINSLKPVMSARGPGEQKQTLTYKIFVDKTTSQQYYSHDDGKTFVRDRYNPDGTRLDPVKDKDIIARLEAKALTAQKGIEYDIYLLDNNSNKKYYTKDGGKTFITDLRKPGQIALRADNPADASLIARLTPTFKSTSAVVACDVWEDTANNNKQYYTQDNGQSFFDDLSNPAGSSFSASDPAHAALVGNLVKVNSTASLVTYYNNYIDPQTNTRYYSNDGGKTFVSRPNDPQNTTLDATRPDIRQIINRLKPECQTSSIFVEVKGYYHPDSGRLVYEHPEKDGRYINELGSVILDSSNPAHITVINRLQEAQETSRVTIVRPYPPEFDVFIYPPTGDYYYSYNDGEIITSRPDVPYTGNYILDPATPIHKQIIDALQPVEAYGRTIEYIEKRTPGRPGGGSIAVSTQEAAQNALVAIERAIVSKDKIRAHLGAMQNRLENTVANLSIQSENLEAAELRISGTDIATEMTLFVRNQVLTQSAVAMLGQANSYPHMLLGLINS